MTVLKSKLCWGTVVHRRYRPKTHELRYRVFSLLVDLDELECIDRVSPIFSVNRHNLLSLHERDHGGGQAEGLKSCIAGKAREAGASAEYVKMLCYPRVLGYAFNPLTVFYCYSAKDVLSAIVYEVNNTFGDRQFYALAVDNAELTVAQSCDKQMYVSPFNTLDGRYEFHVSPPGDRLTVGVNLRVDGKPLLKAYHTAAAEPLTPAGLRRAVVSMPLMTFKVIAGIHYEALRLWLKGLRTTPRPRSDGLKSVALE